jgi:predicted lipid-binding transport protein (Tim44 family)
VKHVSILAVVALTIAALTATDFADARRLGGGRSLGSQRQSIAPTTPSTTPSSPSAAPSTPSGAASNPVMPANPSTAAARATTPPAAPAAAGASRWLGPLAGLAAGIGLAALLSHFGLSEAFASFLLLALIVVAAVFLLRWLFMRRTPARSPMRYAGAGPVEPAAPRGFENHVGPTWGTATAPMPAAAAATAPRIPPGFDVERFAREAKQQFNRLQAAWDAGDRQALSDVMTPRMYAEVERDLGLRTAHQPSEVVTLDAEVLEAAQEGDRYVASVRFHGLMREDGAASPQPFDEVWNLEKPVNGTSGWLLAGIQQLEQAS